MSMNCELEQIINKIKREIQELGKDFKVIVVIENEQIVRYVTAHPPIRSHNISIDDYESMMQVYKENIDTLVGTKSVMMSLSELLDRLAVQESEISSSFYRY